MSWDAFLYLSPEGLLVLVASIIFVFAAGAKAPQWAFPVALGGAGLALAMLVFKVGFANTDTARLGEVSSDPFTLWVRTLCLLFCLLFLSALSRDAIRGQTGEMLGSILLAFCGVMLVASARNLVLIFVGLELVSIPTYLLLYCGKRVVKTQEAAAKYFFLSIFSSAFLLYGFSFLYGHAGSLDLSALAAKTPLGGGPFTIAKLGLVLSLVGLGFKMAAVPFHFYAADVYDGATNGNAGLLAVLPKLAGMITLLKLLVVALPGTAGLTWRILLVMAILSMCVGNLLALWQNRVRRMLALSGVSHAGYLLAGLSVLLVGMESAAGPGDVPAVIQQYLPGILLYLFGYVAAATGCFAALSAMESNRRPLETVDDLAGMGELYPGPAFCLSACLLSMAGAPLLVGFWGKFAVLYSAVALGLQGGPAAHLFLALALFGALNAAVAAAYYLKLVSAMYFRPATGEAEETSPAVWLAAMVAMSLVVLCGLIPSSATSSMNAASEGLSQCAVPREVLAVHGAVPSNVAIASRE